MGFNAGALDRPTFARWADSIFWLRVFLCAFKEVPPIFLLYRRQDLIPQEREYSIKDNEPKGLKCLLVYVSLVLKM